MKEKERKTASYRSETEPKYLGQQEKEKNPRKRGKSDKKESKKIANFKHYSFEDLPGMRKIGSPSRK